MKREVLGYSIFLLLFGVIPFSVLGIVIGGRFGVSVAILGTTLMEILENPWVAIRLTSRGSKLVRKPRRAASDE